MYLNTNTSYKVGMYLLVLALISVLIIIVEVLFGFSRGLKLSLYRLVILLLSIGFTMVMVLLLTKPLSTLIVSLVGYPGFSIQDFFVEIIQDAGLLDGADLLSLPLTGITMSLFGTILFPLIFWILKLVGFIIYLITKSKIDRLGFLKALNRENKVMKFTGLLVGLLIGLLVGGITMMPFICLQGATENKSVQTLASNLLDDDTCDLINVYEENPIKYLYRFTGMEVFSRELGKASTCITIEEYKYSAYTELPYLAEYTKDLNQIIKDVNELDSITDIKVTRKLISAIENTVERVIDIPYYSKNDKASIFQLVFRKISNLDTSKEGYVKYVLDRISLDTLWEVETNIGVILDLAFLLEEEDLFSTILTTNIEEIWISKSTADDMINTVYGFTNFAELATDVINHFVSIAVNDETSNLLKGNAISEDDAQKEELMRVVSATVQILGVSPAEITYMTVNELEKLRNNLFVLYDSPMVDDESFRTIYIAYLGDIDLEYCRYIDGYSLRELLDNK